MRSLRTIQIQHESPRSVSGLRPFKIYNLIDDIGADSLDVVELIMSLEDNYGIRISDDDAANLVTVRKIVDYIERMQ